MSNKNHVIEGGKWITISTGVSTVFQFLQIAVLARLLGPSEFGLVSISTLLIGFFNIFGNLGFSNSIISKQENNRDILSTLYLLNLGLGVLIFVILFFATPWVVDFYDESRLTRVLRFSSLYFLIVYVGQLYSFLLQKELHFKAIALTEIISTLLGTAATVAFAMKGFEEMSLIYGQLITQALKSLMLLYYGLKLFVPKFAFDLFKVKDHILFGVYNIGDGFLGFIQAHTDKLIIGSMLGVEPLGFYTVAYQLAVFPITKLNPIVLQVAYPVLAKMKDNVAELKRSYVKILDIVSYLNMPLLAGLFITAESVVPIFYGPGWEGSIHLIQIFVFVSFFYCLSHPLYTLAFTRNQPKLLFYLNLMTLIVKLPLILVLGYYWEVTGVAFAFLLSNIFNFLVNFHMAKSLIGNFFKQFWSNLSFPLCFCGLMVAVILIYKNFVGNEGLMHSLFEISIGGGIYIGLTFLFKFSLNDLKLFKKSI